MEILALLQAAQALAPVIGSAIGFVESSIAGAPLTSAEADTALGALSQAAVEVPILAPVLALVQKQFDGVPLTDADIATMQSVSEAIDSQIAAKTTQIEASP